MTMLHLVLLETSGNQEYLFSTNRLRENVGASELVYQAGTRLVLEAVARLESEKDREQEHPLWPNSLNPAKLRKKILAQNPDDIGRKIWVVVATSGKAMVLVNDCATGKALVSDITRHALEQMPGLDICGVVSEEFNWTTKPLNDVVKEVHEKFSRVRTLRPTPAARFPHLPVLEPCASSGWPASTLDRDRTGGEWRPVSRVSVVKRERYGAWRDRLREILEKHSADTWLARHLEDMADLEGLDEVGEGAWSAVVHADGNGLGKIFLAFDQHLGIAGDASRNAYYAQQLQQFSAGLEEATEKAFCDALAVFPEASSRTNRLPVVPLVLGGDDLTAVVRGRWALAFIKRFLQAFEVRSTENKVITRVAQKALGKPRLSACAGVAVIKPHFPFHSAYQLADQLIRSAKKVKSRVTDTAGRSLPCSALDFHLLFDASFSGLDTIRERMVVEDTRLTAGPYVVSELAYLKKISETAGPWALDHHINGLLARVGVLKRRDEEGRRRLPNSQMHDLREALQAGPRVADQRFGLLRKRYHRADIGQLGEGEGETLYRDIQPPPGKPDLPARETRFLDAITSTTFWKGEPGYDHD